MEAVNGAVDPQLVREILRALVKVPSINPPGGTAEAVAAFEPFFREAGISTERYTSRDDLVSLVARLPGRAPGKTLVLNGHLDIVPPGEGWSLDPFAALEKDGRVYGRGSADMKAGLTGMAAAMIALKRSGAAFNGEIILMAVPDEETGGRYGTRYLLEQGVGMGADFAIVGEPTSGRIELGNRGVAWFEVRIDGVAGHSGRPHQMNPIHFAGRLIAALAAMKFDLRNDIFEVPVPTLTVTMMEGGVKANVIPNLAKLTIDRRLLPGETAELARQQIEEVIAGIDQPGVSATVTSLQGAEPYLIEQSSPVVQALSDSYRQVYGGEPVYSAKGAGTDGGLLYSLGGVPTALFGAADPTRAHTVDEYVELEAVVKSAKVYAQTALRLLGDCREKR